MSGIDHTLCECVIRQLTECTLRQWLVHIWVASVRCVACWSCSQLLYNLMLWQSCSSVVVVLRRVHQRETFIEHLQLTMISWCNSGRVHGTAM